MDTQQPEVTNIPESKINQIYEKELVPGTPLYDMFCKHSMQIIAFFKRDHIRNMLPKFTNMFCLQLIMIEFTMFISILFAGKPEMLIPAFGVVSAGLVCGIYSVATRDPVGMILYSILNFIGLVTGGLVYIYYPLNCISFTLLLLNQIRALGYIIEFGREKLTQKNQDLTHSLSNIYQSNV